MKNNLQFSLSKILPALLLSGCLAFVTAQASTWDVDDDGDWSVGANWTAGVPNGISASALLDVDGGISANRTVTLDVDVTLGSLTLNDSNGDPQYFSWIIDSADDETLTFQTSSGNASFVVSRGTENAVHAPVTLASTTDFNVASGAMLTLSDTLSGSSQLPSLGAGTIRLEGNNSGFSGGFFFNTSTRLEIAHANALGTGAITMGAFSAGGTLHNDTGAMLVIDNQITTRGNWPLFTFSGSDMTLNNLNLSPSNTVDHGFSIATGTTITLPNGIASGGARKAGGGNLTITAASSGNLRGWEGGGTLRIGHDEALGTAADSIRIRTGTYIAEGGDRTIANIPHMTLTGAAMTFDLTNGNNLTFSAPTASITHDGTITVNGTGILTIAGDVTGNFRPAKAGTGTLHLMGDNSGADASNIDGVRLDAGTLGLGHDNALGASTNRLRINGSSTLTAVG